MRSRCSEWRPTSCTDALPPHSDRESANPRLTASVLRAILDPGRLVRDQPVDRAAATSTARIRSAATHPPGYGLRTLAPSGLLRTPDRVVPRCVARPWRATVVVS